MAQGLVGVRGYPEPTPRDLGLSEPFWLIPDISGLPWRWKMTSVMPACVKQAGITPRATTHDLRHTFATQLRRHGAPLETLKELLCHKDITDTLIYAHYSMDEAFGVIDRIDQTL